MLSNRIGICLYRHVSNNIQIKTKVSGKVILTSYDVLTLHRSLDIDFMLLYSSIGNNVQCFRGTVEFHRRSNIVDKQ